MWKRAGANARNEAQSLADQFWKVGSAPQAAALSSVLPAVSPGGALFGRGQLLLVCHKGFLPFSHAVLTEGVRRVTRVGQRISVTTGPSSHQWSGWLAFPLLQTPVVPTEQITCLSCKVCSNVIDDLNLTQGRCYFVHRREILEGTRLCRRNLTTRCNRCLPLSRPCKADHYQWLKRG